MNKKLLTEEELINVCGGNFGDYDNDNKAMSMYEVGQRVEVYTTLLHITTTTAVIKKKNFNAKYGKWEYTVKYCKTGTWGWNGEELITANDIER